MKYLLTLSLALILCSCYNTAAQKSATNPCNDPQFVELKKKEIGAMTEREYDYFKLKSAECSSYNMVDHTQENVGKSVSAIWIVTGIITVVGIIAILLAGSSY